MHDDDFESLSYYLLQVPAHCAVTLRHDPLCDELAEAMREAGVPAVREDVASFSRVPMAHAEVLQRLFAQGGGADGVFQTISDISNHI